MRVMILGLRGIPAVEGGIENHVENLCQLLTPFCDVEVIVRKPYWKGNPKGDVWRGIQLTPLWSPCTSVLETGLHTFIGVLYAALKRPDLLHIHGIGPALMAPLARLLGLRVVVTHHTTDYDREKWGTLAKLLLRAGEWAGMRFAHKRIVVSQVIREVVEQKYHQDCVVIPNGVVFNEPAKTQTCLQKFDLTAGRYIIYVGRLDPGKRQIDLIKAFEQANLKDWKLVLVGKLESTNPYAQRVVTLARQTKNVVLTDFQKGRDLQELYAHAGMFAMTSSHEGLPIVLLEALSYGLPVIASNIPINLEIGLPSSHYFAVGDITSLAEKLKHVSEGNVDPQTWTTIRAKVKEKYNWHRIAKETLAVYQSTATPSKGSGMQNTSIVLK
jgi:glycosyltransferase involved in cell wall biosynthesis